MTAMDSLSLGQLFDKGQTIFNDIAESSLASRDDAYQAQVKEGLLYLERADHGVVRLSMFSANEELRDINPNDLKFLLIPAYIGDLTLKLMGGQRRSILMSAQSFFERFLKVCHDYKLLNTDDASLLDEEGMKRPNAAQQREQKIARYRREKTIREHMIELRKQGEYQENEDAQRKVTLALIELHTIKAIESILGIKQELVMVQEQEEREKRMESQGNSVAEDHRAPARATWGRDKPLLNKAGQPLQPFVITKRQQLQDQVFRPGWSLPTMTIDEYLQQEEERGNIIQGGGKEPEEKIIDDNDEAALDAETMKKREWDEFTEANPRGAGNRGNKG